MTVTGVGMNRDGIPDALQQPQIGFDSSVQYGGPVSHGAPTMTVTGVDMNRDGIPDVRQPQISCTAPVLQAAPAVTYSTHSLHAAPAPVVDNISHLEQCEELVSPSPQPQSHRDDVSADGPKVAMPKSRKAHDVPVRGVVRGPSGRTRQVPLCKVPLAPQRSLPLRTPGCRCHRSGGDQG